jgi:hypothetical protein
METIEYQPAWFTQRYRLMVSPVGLRLAQWLFDHRWEWIQPHLTRLVRRSVAGLEPGGNSFMVVRKRSGT